MHTYAQIVHKYLPIIYYVDASSSHLQTVINHRLNDNYSYYTRTHINLNDNHY